MELSQMIFLRETFIAPTYSPSTLYALIGSTNFGHLLSRHHNGAVLELGVLNELNDSDFSVTDSEEEGENRRDFRIDSGFDSS